jgi:adenylate cyclase
MAGQIFACGGTIEKYIGDEIFAVFGLPTASPHDALNALRSAGLMLKELAAWNETRAQKGEPPLGIGIGVNYGPAVMGDVGSEQTLSFTVIGDTVNIASRLQALTRELRTPLIVADPVLKQIGDSPLPVALTDGGDRELRGRSAPIRIWTAEPGGM